MNSFNPAGEQLFKTILTEAPIATALYAGKDMVIQFANQAILDLWGKDESVIGKKLSDALAGDDITDFLKILDTVYLSGKTYHSSEQHAELKVNGAPQSFWFNFTCKPLLNAAGEVYAIIDMAIDVTEQVKSRNKLKEIQENTRFALDSAGMGTWTLYPLARIVEWDERCKELCGYHKHDKIDYDETLKFVYPDDIARVQEAVITALTPGMGGNYDVDIRVIPAEDGRQKWIRCKGKAYFNADGDAYKFSGTVVDITDEKRKEQALKNVEQRFETAFNNADIGIMLSDTAGNFMLVNKAFSSMTGYTQDELNSSNFFAITHPDDLAYNREITAPLYNGEVTSVQFHKRYVRKDGSDFWVDINTTMIYDEQRRQDCTLSIVRDITAELAAQEEQRKLIFLIDNSSDFVSLSDLDGNVSYLNKAGRRMMGFADQKEAQRHNSTYLSAGEIDRLGTEVNKDLFEKGSWTGHITYRNFKTGELIPVYGTSMLVKDPVTGKPVGRASIARDLRAEISSREQLQAINKELNDQVRQFEFVTDFMPVQLWTAGTDGQLDYVNKRAMEYFGTSAENIIGEAWQDKIHPDDLARCQETWMHSLQTGEIYQYEFRLMDKDGIYRWHLARALPFVMDDQLIRWFGTNTDINEQKELQRQKDEFIGIASHELKTPVTSIKAYAQVLEIMLRKKGDMREADMLGKMNQQVDRLTKLISDLLDVTRIQSGRIQFNKTAFDFNAMVSDVIEEVQRTSASHQIVQEFTPAGTVYADKDRLGQVIINLLTNAIKYSPAANKVVVATKVCEAEVIISVQDFGIGIPVDKKERIFEQFYRVTGPGHLTFPGLGLGLYIAAEIIKREGGRIWADSCEDAGSTFYFGIPVGANG